MDAQRFRDYIAMAQREVLQNGYFAEGHVHFWRAHGQFWISSGDPQGTPYRELYPATVHFIRLLRKQ